jgi:uncharacterized protein YvpB
VLGTLAIFSICILLIIIGWNYLVVNGGKNVKASEAASNVENSGELTQNSGNNEAQTDVNNVNSSSDNTTAATAGSSSDNTTATETQPYTYTQIVTEFVTGSSDTEKYVDTDLEEKYIVMNELLQRPSLPTGCEITSLTAVLNFWGYSVSKETMSDNYLEKKEVGEATAYEAFLGDPTTNSGYGCFAPVIVKAANKYLSENNSFYRAYDLSGTSLEDLYAEINQNHPVIVWATINMGEPRFYDQWKQEDGTYAWVGNEHCLVLTGYNKTTNSIYVMDPLAGNVKYDLTLFNTRYEQLLKQAVVIK